MVNWLSGLSWDPVPALLDSSDRAICFRTRRDLLDAPACTTQSLWALPEVHRLVTRQLPSGTWPTTTDRRWAANPTGQGLVEAYRWLRLLVDQYALDRRHLPIERAVEYVLSCQTDEGDIRGILANQYAPYYTGALLGLAIKAGYADDPRVEAGLRWLLTVRQDDGGWAPGSPGMVALPPMDAAQRRDMTVDPQYPTARAFDRSRPFSAAATGMVIRAFAAHPEWSHTEAARTAGLRLKSRLLRADNWPSYRHPDHWVRFDFPFWWTNLVSALDALSRLGFGPSDDDIGRGMSWLAEHQQPNGLWLTSYSRIHKTAGLSDGSAKQLWVTLAICRVWRRLTIGCSEQAEPS